MYNLNNLSVLVIKPKDIKTGFVQSAAKNNKYFIRVGKSHVSASSTMDLLPGQRVVVGKSTDGWVILNSENLSSLTITKIKIRG